MTIRSLLAAVAVLALVACGNTPPAPDWQMNAKASAERATQAWLTGDQRVEAAEFARARREVASTGQPALLARVELLRCAGRVAIGVRRGLFQHPRSVVPAPAQGPECALARHAARTYAAEAVMSEAAAECYEVETGHGFIPAAGSRASVRAQETGAVFEARQLLEQHDRETAEKSKVEGVPLIVSGATDWTDVDVIFNTLDKVRERIKQNRNQEIFLCHKGGKHGAEMIAARWARARGVAQARFDPRWSAHGRTSC
mgnify:CR=1 FL=1